mmetsp:Transcript_10075/g.21793  ORF Transcript_10075/g.21793 Transcript_10075/m.21793 type:complete len:235 (-) Transcript_10075:474-1178(-)
MAVGGSLPVPPLPLLLLSCRYASRMSSRCLLRRLLRPSSRTTARSLARCSLASASATRSSVQYPSALFACRYASSSKFSSMTSLGVLYVGRLSKVCDSYLQKSWSPKAVSGPLGAPMRPPGRDHRAWPAAGLPSAASTSSADVSQRWHSASSSSTILCRALLYRSFFASLSRCVASSSAVHRACRSRLLSTSARAFSAVLIALRRFRSSAARFTLAVSRALARDSRSRCSTNSA